MTDATPETWLPVPDYEGIYEVSNLGQVWSFPRPRTKGGIMRLFPDKHGYPWVTLTKNGEQKRRAVHQLVAAAFIGPCPEGQEVRHKDGDPTNPRVDNLIYGTHGENMLDKREHGTDHNTAKTHCPEKHKYTPENTLINKAGSRVCLTCKRERALEWYHANATHKDPRVICRHCGEEFIRQPDMSANRKYCTEECFVAARQARQRKRRAA